MRGVTSIMLVAMLVLVVVTACTKTAPIKTSTIPPQGTGTPATGSIINSSNSSDLGNEIVLDTPNDLGSLDDLNVSQEIPE